MYNYIITALIAAALSFVGAWKTQEWRYDAKEKKNVEIVLGQERERHSLDNKRISAVISADNVSIVRERVLRAAAADARNELDGLRIAIENSRAAARLSLSSCLVRADAIDTVFRDCADKYQALGAVADRHSNDSQKLTAAGYI